MGGTTSSFLVMLCRREMEEPLHTHMHTLIHCIYVCVHTCNMVYTHPLMSYPEAAGELQDLNTVIKHVQSKPCFGF
jgi:hypothetical protein